MSNIKIKNITNLNLDMGHGPKQIGPIIVNEY